MKPDSAIVNWSPPENDGGSPVTNYILEYRRAGDKVWKAATKDVADTEFTVPNLQEGKEYEFRVAAVNKAGEGPFSKPSDVTKYGKNI